MLLIILSLITTDIKVLPYTPPVIKGVYLSSGVIYSGYHLDDFFRMVNVGLLNCAVLDIKDVKGRIMFSVYEDFIKKAKENNVYLIARHCVFKDRYLALRDSGKYALKDTSGHIWFEEKCGYWVDPSLKEVRDYNMKIIEKAYRFGFDEVQFDYIRYPSCKKPYKNNRDKLQNILSFLDEASLRKPEGKRMSLTVYGYTVWGSILINEGQNLEMMSERVDVVYPMLYPSHFHDNFMSDSSYESRTYNIVFESVIKANNRLSDINVQIIPYIQAFDWKKSRMGKNYIKNQLKAVHSSGGKGFILWEAGGEYKQAYVELIELDIELSIKRLKLLHP